MLRAQRINAAGMLIAASLFISGAALAQQLNPGISCLKGSVPAADWAEFDSRYKESIWDSKAAIRLNSNNEALELSVKDEYGNTVCEQTADMKTRCKFKFASDYSGTFTIRVDNLLASESGYTLCAE